MGIQRMDNTAIVVADMEAAVAFFLELGMEEEGRAIMEGPIPDQCVGLEGVRTEIVMMKVPDGQGRIELTRYDAPEPIVPEPAAPNTIGFHRVMFAVDDIEDTLARLRPHGAELLGEVANYEDVYKLCYLRGPDGIVVGLAEQIG